VASLLSFAVAAWFIIYLHVLAARTGLLVLYLSLAVAGGHYLLVKRSFILNATAFVLPVLLPVLAWYSLPSFQNRIKYIRYDFAHIQKNVYLPGSNDGNHLFFLKAGLGVLQSNPWALEAATLKIPFRVVISGKQPQSLLSTSFFPVVNGWSMAEAWDGLV
jgi:hypothetical protein